MYFMSFRKEGLGDAPGRCNPMFNVRRYSGYTLVYGCYHKLRYKFGRKQNLRGGNYGFRNGKSLFSFMVRVMFNCGMYNIILSLNPKKGEFL
jgi:hypothetical protein